MTSKPVRLRYNDATNGMTTIGSMFTGNDNINTVTIKNSAEEFNKVIIEGRNDLQEALPVSENRFGPAQNGENEPEILVEVFDNGSWSVRERCYALEGGSVDDNGNYKNKKLYGHEKYTGEKRVETATISTDIEACMQELMPAGYSLQVPGDVNIPEVNEWSYKGLRENAYLELTRNYDWVLMFTSDLDADNNYIVRFEPSGYGGSEGNIVRGQDPIVYDYWKKKDTKTIVSEVTVKGEDSSGSTVQETVQASNPDLERSVSLRVGYPITVSEAQDIGDNLLQPSFVEHGALQGPLFLDNTVNFTVGIQDSNLNIDDEFTVVEQKDFLHEGQTYFSFEFENEANIRESLRNKGLDEERSALFGQGEDNINIDFDEFEAKNTDAEADVSTSEDDSDQFGSYVFDAQMANANQADGGSVSISENLPIFFSPGMDIYLVNANVEFHDTGTSTDGLVNILVENVDENKELFNESFDLFTLPSNRTFTILEDVDDGGDEIRLTATNNTGESLGISLDLTLDAVGKHKHNVSAFDNGHGGSGSVSELEHKINGETAEQLIEILQQFKSDR